VLLRLANPLSLLLDRGFLETAILRQFQPLFEPEFLERHLEKHIEHGDGTTLLNPREMDEEDYTALYRAAL
jgi:hypothetical protein